MKWTFMLLAAGLCVTTSEVVAEPASPLPSEVALVDAASLTEDQLRQAIADKTVYLNISGFELPIRYAANGRMKGSMGITAARFSAGDGSRDSGRWWIAENQLCQRWTSWLDGKTYCYKITREGNIIHWLRSDGAEGTARIED
jgi:hypothetical protein